MSVRQVRDGVESVNFQISISSCLLISIIRHDRGARFGGATGMRGLEDVEVGSTQDRRVPA
jgi:hypothetical protein